MVEATQDRHANACSAVKQTRKDDGIDYPHETLGGGCGGGLPISSEGCLHANVGAVNPVIRGVESRRRASRSGKYDGRE